MASEYLKWKYRDVRPDEKIEYTKKEKARNWWQYHKWWLLAGALVLAAAGDILFSALGLGQVKPDYQLAYVAAVPPGDETAASIEAALAAMGEDCNGDGRVTVQVHVYADMSLSSDSDAAQYAAAAKVKLMADMESCESYFFLCDQPETLQENYQILAREDGELAGPAETPETIAWEDVSMLKEIGEGGNLPEGLRLARRGFWENRVCRYREQCDALWDRITEESEP